MYPNTFRTPVHTPAVSSPQKRCHLVVGHTLKYIVSKNEVNWTDSSRDIDIFVSYPLLKISPILTIISTWPPSTWDMAESTLTPQQLISQSAQATADAIASALTVRTASISLPIYDWNSQDAYHSFSIFCWPWRTGSSSTAFHLTVRTTSGMFLQL